MMAILFYISLVFFVAPGLGILILLEKFFNYKPSLNARGKNGLNEFLNLCFWVGVDAWAVVFVIIGMLIYFLKE